MSQAGIATGGGGGGSNIQTITGDSGGAVSPDAAHNINLDALYTNSVVGTPLNNTLTITPTVRGYPITPYVVGPATFAGYQTIQAGIDAASLGGGGLVFIQRGTYTENLVFPAVGNVQLFGDSEQATFIVGTHTPPTSGTLNINRCTFESATNIFNSLAAGTTVIIMEDCTVNATNGYTFNLPNWVAPGALQCFNIGPFGTNDGFINNTGGAEVAIFAAGVGNGTLNPMILSGSVLFGPGITIGCPVNLVTGANVVSTNNQFFQTFTFSNDSTGSFFNDSFVTGATPAITQSSTGTISLSNVVINSSSNPAVSGAGAGILTYAGIVFLDNTTFAGTLTLQPANWRPYGTAGSAINAVRGTAGFDSTRFTVTNGFVTLNGAGFTWVDQGVSTTLLLNTGYYVTAATTQTLPAAPQQGDTVKIICDTASAVVVTANAGQSIRLSSSASSVAGTFTNTARGDSLDLFYRAATTQWIALNAVGNWTVA